MKTAGSALATAVAADADLIDAFTPIELDRGALRQDLVGRFIRLQAAGGALTICAIVVATLVANGRWASAYFGMLGTMLGPLSIQGWINDVLMPGFFLVLALRLKREWRLGQLSMATERRFAIVAAVSGSILPAVVFLIFAGVDGHWPGGLAASWSAGLACALAVASLLDGKLLPQVRIVLALIVILSDLSAAVLIALLASFELHVGPAVLTAALLGALLALGRGGVAQRWPYVVALVCLWPAAWLAGLPLAAVAVLAGLLVPVLPELVHLEYRLHPVVALAVLPLFAFANLGLSFAGLALHDLGAPLTIAVLLALVIGKPLGIVAGTRLATSLRLARLPEGLSWMQLCGIAALCGVGGTVSMVLGSALSVTPPMLLRLKLAILLGSLFSAVLGYALLRHTRFRRR